MWEEYHKALFPPDARIYGRYLRTYTLWHEEWLNLVESPFIFRADGPARVTSRDLLTALQICATSYPEHPDFGIHARDLGVLLAAWLFPERFRRAAAIFAAWRARALISPRLGEMTVNAAPRLMTAPSRLSLVAFFLARGQADTQVWNWAPCYAEWICAAIQERDGAGGGFVDGVPWPELPDVEAMSEAEIYAQAKADLGEARARKFMRARAARKRKEAPAAAAAAR